MPLKFLSLNVCDIGNILYIPCLLYTSSVTELIDKLPDIEVRGSLEKWQASILATQIDQFSYDYDTYQYRDTVEDRDCLLYTSQA